MDEVDNEQIFFMTPLQTSHVSETSPSDYYDLEGSFSQREHQEHMANLTRDLQIIANRCYDSNDSASESDIPDQQPTEATDDGIDSSQRHTAIVHNHLHPHSLEEQNAHGIPVMQRSDPLDESFASVTSDTETILLEEEHHQRPVFNYSHSLRLAYTDDDDDIAMIKNTLPDTSDISLDFEGIIKKEKDNIGHIMISCDDSTKAWCSRIATYLRDRDYEVWFDRATVAGNVFTTMASAVENSFVILMAVNEAYNQCRYCRLEAEYSMEQNKPSIPMMMQAGYRPQGWLGIINGSKLHIDFAQLPFDQACTLLVREIEAVRLSSEATGIHRTVTMPVSNQITTVHNSWPSGQSVRDWSANDVIDWLSREKLEVFEAALTSFTGAALWQLYKVKLELPAEYYRMVETLLPATMPLRLLHNLNFNSALETLFSTSPHTVHR